VIKAQTEHPQLLESGSTYEWAICSIAMPLPLSAHDAAALFDFPLIAQDVCPGGSFDLAVVAGGALQSFGIVARKRVPEVESSRPTPRRASQDTFFSSRLRRE